MTKFEALTNATTIFMHAETFFHAGSNHISSYVGIYEVRLHILYEEQAKMVEKELKKLTLTGCEFKIRNLEDYNTCVLTITWKYE